MNESGKAGAVRVRRITPSKLTEAELHGKRLDTSGRERRIRNADPVTTTGLDLTDLYKKHAADARRSTNGNCKALHVLVKWPAALVDGSDPDWMLQKSREFAERIFGDRAIFADRVDRDEKSLVNVDLFLAPRYVKTTRAGDAEWISTSKDLKALAKKYDRKPTLRGQGHALQDAWFEYLLELGLDAERGEEKTHKWSDWKTPEVIKAEATIKDAKQLKEAVETAQKLYIDERKEFVVRKKKFDVEASEDENERIKLKAIAAGIDHFAHGRIVGALVYDDGRKTFKFGDHVSKKEREAIFNQVKPAALAVWEFVRDQAARLKSIQLQAANVLERLNKTFASMDKLSKQEHLKSITPEDQAAINAAAEWHRRQSISRD